MSDIKYDPEFPYVYVTSNDVPEARFRVRSDADTFSDNFAGYGAVIDTTPKPKIPEGAEFVYVELKDGPYYIRKRDNGSWEDHTQSQFDSTDHLERFLKGEGDAEVTVLVRKEES